MRFDRHGRPVHDGPTPPQRHRALAQLLDEAQASRSPPPADDLESRVERAKAAIWPGVGDDVRERARAVRAHLRGDGQADPGLAERTAQARAALYGRDPAVEARAAAARAAIRGEHAIRARR